MTVLDATVAPSPRLTGSMGTGPSTAVSSKQLVVSSEAQLSALTPKIYRHTRTTPISEDVLKVFLDVINASFAGERHDKNFGSKPRYATTQLLLDDLNHGVEGAWIFMLFTPKGQAVAGAKITFSGKGMDGGPGIYACPDPLYTPLPQIADLPIAWLGALGSILPGAGSVLISHIKSFLSTSVYPNAPFRIRAYTVAEWGVNESFTVPRDSPILAWFSKQGFSVLDYSWKPPGTWESFYGGCMATIEYVQLLSP